jgi:hypothetical protein
VQPLWKSGWRFLKKTKTRLPLLGTYPKAYKSTYKRDTCTPMFIAALFTIAKLWNQPRCPTTNAWIKKKWHTYMTKYYSSIKKNKITLFARK